MPARYREHHFRDHFQGPHFAYIDIIEEEIKENDLTNSNQFPISFKDPQDGRLIWFARRLDITFINHEGKVVMSKSIPLKSTSIQDLSMNSIGTNASAAASAAAAVSARGVSTSISTSCDP